MSRLQSARYLTTQVDPSQLGDCLCEVAFVGRSNVGKSSVLNALCQQKNLARVSQTPGRTRTINVFLVENNRWVVDLPGYGFAVGPESERRQWRQMIEGYLTGRTTLRMVYVLIDAKVGPTNLDHQMVKWLQNFRIPYCLVANKADQVKSSRAFAQRRDIAAVFGLQRTDLLWVSCRTGEGIQSLRQAVVKVLEL